MKRCQSFPTTCPIEGKQCPFPSVGVPCLPFFSFLLLSPSCEIYSKTIDQRMQKPHESPPVSTNGSSCSLCCLIYTARLKLDPKGYNSIQYFRAVTLLVAAITIVLATILVGRQLKRRPDINSFQRKLLLFVIGLIVIHMIGGILPITMGSIVMAYGYDGNVPWYLWVWSKTFFESLPSFFLNPVF